MNLFRGHVMGQYEKASNIIKGLKVNILAISKDKFHYRNNVLNIPKEYKGTDNNDVLFRMLYLSGQSIYKKEDEYLREQNSVNWAIKQARDIGLKISSNEVEEIHRRLNEIADSEFKYDVTGIYDPNIRVDNNEGTTLAQLIEEYGLPLEVRKSDWPKNVFFNAEAESVHGTVSGVIFIGENPYEESNYNNRYAGTEIFELYEKEAEQVVVPPAYVTDLEYNKKIKERIKKRDRFIEYSTNEEDSLYNHQKAGCLLARRYNKFAFFYDTGTGKTIMSLAVIQEKHRENGSKFMIVSPLAIIRTAWMEDSQKCFPDMRILPLSKNYTKEDYYQLYKQWEDNSIILDKNAINEKEWTLSMRSDAAWEKVWDKLVELAQHYIINIEKYRSKTAYYLNSFGTKGLIIDESAILKNYTSKTSRMMLDVSKKYDYVYLLSGKPAPNNHTEYYTQMKIVDPVSFDMTNANFIKRFFNKDRSKYYFKGELQEKTVADMIAKRSLIVSKEDCIVLPEVRYNTVNVQLSSSEMEYYDEMFEGCLDTIVKQQDEYKNKNIYYSTNCKLAVMTKLRQIASGFFIENKYSTVGLHSKKLNALLQIVEENINEPMIIWCQFEYEIQLLEKQLAKYGKVVTAYGKSKNIDDNIYAFKHGQAKYIIAHPKSIKYGVTFTDCCKAVYYSLSYSAEDYYQSRDRIYRLGQKRNCDYYFIIAQDTIDEIIQECINDKMSNAEIFGKIIKHAANHGIDYSAFKDEIAAPKENVSVSTQKIVDKYKFTLVDQTSFMYEKNGETYQRLLYNKAISASDKYHAEEILFEVTLADLFADADVTYTEVEHVCRKVLDELKSEKVKITKRCIDYLNQQVEKQYEIDMRGEYSEQAVTPVNSLSDIRQIQ